MLKKNFSNEYSHTHTHSPKSLNINAIADIGCFFLFPPKRGVSPLNYYSIYNIV